MDSNSISAPVTTTTTRPPTHANNPSPTSASSGANAPSSSSVHQSHQHSSQHHEDRLNRTWRSLESSLLFATSKAEKVDLKDHTSIREVDEAVVGFLRTRVELVRLISYLEAKLEGRIQEVEILQHFVRCQPCLGSRKRKRDDAITDSTTI